MNRDLGRCAWLAKQQVTARAPNSGAVHARSRVTAVAEWHDLEGDLGQLGNLGQVVQLGADHLGPPTGLYRCKMP